MTIEQKLAAVRKWMARAKDVECDDIGCTAAYDIVPAFVAALEKVLEEMESADPVKTFFGPEFVVNIIYTTLRDAGCVPEQEVSDDR